MQHFAAGSNVPKDEELMQCAPAAKALHALRIMQRVIYIMRLIITEIVTQIYVFLDSNLYFSIC